MRTAVENCSVANEFWLISLETELGRVMQNKDRAFSRCHPRLCRCEMSSQDNAFIDARIIEEPISRFGGCPVLTGFWQCRADLLAKLTKQLIEPLFQACVRKLTPLDLIFDPAFHGPDPPPNLFASNERTEGSDLPQLGGRDTAIIVGN
jgi:hypothetical protein